MLARNENYFLITMGEHLHGLFKMEHAAEEWAVLLKERGFLVTTLVQV